MRLECRKYGELAKACLCMRPAAALLKDSGRCFYGVTVPRMKSRGYHPLMDPVDPYSCDRLGQECNPVGKGCYNQVQFYDICKRRGNACMGGDWPAIVPNQWPGVLAAVWSKGELIYQEDHYGKVVEDSLCSKVKQ